MLPATPDPLAFLLHGGAMGDRMREHDWAATPLGPPARWPQSLRTAVALMLRSRQPVFVGWGPQLLSFFNDGFIGILGERHTQYLGQPMERVWADVWNVVRPLVHAALRGKAGWYEDVPLHLAGRAHPGPSHFSFSSTPLLDDTGAIGGVFFSAIETTEKVLLERRRAEHAANQQRLFEQAPGFICTLRGPDHVFEFVNDAYRRMFRRQVVGRPMREAFPDLEGQGFFEQLDRVWRTGERYVAHNVPMRLRTGPGDAERELRLDFIYAPILDPHGQVAGIFCEGHDVTETYEVQRTLAEREEQLRLATEAGEVGLWDVDLVSDTMYWQPRVRAMFGIFSDVPVTLADFHAGLHPDDRERTVHAFAAACDPQRRALFDMEYRTVGRDDGVVRWVAAKGRALFDADGRCVRVIGTAIDISARKAAEAQLRASEERLRESDRRKDEFLATLAHELRNPLAPLRNALHLQRLQGETGRLHAMMDRQVNHLVHLVDDLLEISRISRGTLELRTDRVDLAASVRAAMEACTPLITQRGHDLRVDLPAEPLWVDGDPVRLTQIASNLVNNAALYTPPGGRIEVTAEAVHGRALLRVRDTGAGFAAGELPQLFEMFRRGPGSSGLGVGLALSQRLTQLHGGTLEGASAGEGQGATFTCSLPLAPAPPQRTQRVAHQALDGLRILVVDDNRDAAETLEELLRHLGAQVRVAFDGREALASVQDDLPTVVLLDIGMPEMNGYEVARELRSRYGPALRLVALSGWGQEVDRARGRAAGFDHHLIKPADIDALRALLDEILCTPGPRRP